MATEQEERFRRAQERVLAVMPTWEPLVRALRPVPKWNFKGQVRIRNGTELWFDRTLDEDTLAGGMFELVDHWFYRHKQRTGDRDPALWNEAADLEFHHRWGDIPYRAGFAFPHGDPRDEHPDLGRDEAERLYERLQQQGRQGGRGQGDGDGGDVGDLGDPAAGPAGEGRPGQPGEGTPGQGRPESGRPQPGSGQPGTPGAGEHDADLGDSDFDDDLLEALMAMGAFGDQEGASAKPGSASAGRRLTQPPAVIFGSVMQRVIRKLLSGRTPVDFRFNPPSNRSPDPLVLSRARPRPHKVGVVFDTSGSVDDEMRSAYAAMGRQIRRNPRVGSVVAACGDTKLTLRPGPLEYVLRHWKGGGGTKMDVVVWDAYRSAAFRGCTRLLLITDGETPWPKEFPPNTRILLVNDRVPTIPKHVAPFVIDRITKRQLLMGSTLQRQRGRGMA